MKKHLGKCPNCGGNLYAENNENTAMCDSCGSMIPLSELNKPKQFITHTGSEATKNENGEYESAFDTSALTMIDRAEIYNKAELALSVGNWNLASRYSNELIRRDPTNFSAYLIALLADFKVNSKEELANLHSSFTSNGNYKNLMRFAPESLRVEIENYNAKIQKAAYEESSEKAYQVAKEKIKSTYVNTILRGITSLESLGDYKDAKKLVEDAKKQIAILKRKEARQKMFGLGIITIIIMIIIVSVISSQYNYSEKRLDISIDHKSNVEITSNRTTCAFTFKIYNSSKYTVSEIFGVMKVKDSSGNTLMTSEISLAGDLSSGDTSTWTVDVYMSSGTDYSNSIWNMSIDDMEITFRISKLVFEDGKIKEYDTKDRIVKKYDKNYKSKQYESALNYYSSKNYDAAYEIFVSLGDYKDSIALSSSCLVEMEKQLVAELKSELISAKVGEIVTFGSYEQDYDYLNGDEPIEWLILAKEDDKVLLISVYALESVEYDYDTTDDHSSWAASSLRKWLNGDFLSTSFTDEEAALIDKTDVIPSDVEEKYGGIITNDKIFILSAEELEEYLPYGQHRSCVLTEYTYNTRGWWNWYAYWVRTPNDNNEWYIQYIDQDGYIDDEGRYLEEVLTVRPALWISTGK